MRNTKTSERGTWDQHAGPTAVLSLIVVNLSECYLFLLIGVKLCFRQSCCKGFDRWMHTTFLRRLQPICLGLRPSYETMKVSSKCEY